MKITVLLLYILLLLTFCKMNQFLHNMNFSLWFPITYVNISACFTTYVRCLGSAAVRRSTSTQSWPQAEISICLVKVQGYRWVTKPPLITNHFCHESQFQQKEAKKHLYQTKKSDRTCTFVIWRCLWLGVPAYFALGLFLDFWKSHLIQFCSHSSINKCVGKLMQMYFPYSISLFHCLFTEHIINTSKHMMYYSP